MGLGVSGTCVYVLEVPSPSSLHASYPSRLRVSFSWARAQNGKTFSARVSSGGSPHPSSVPWLIVKLYPEVFHWKLAKEVSIYRRLRRPAPGLLPRG